MSISFRSLVLTVLNARYATVAKLTLRCRTLATVLRFTSQRTLYKTQIFTSETYPHPFFWIMVCIALISLLPWAAFGADISLHGFFQGNYSFSSRPNPDGGDFKWAEERMQLKLVASKEPFRVFIKTDAFLDHIDKNGELELREGYIDYTAMNWDIRTGRQIITWGLGDLLFINDVFPKDYDSFFSGRPLEYLKKGVDGIRLGIYPAFASFEFIAIPMFETNDYPDSKRFYMFDPMPDVTNREKKDHATNIKNTEFALRIYRDIAGFDASLYFYRGYFRQPWMMPDNPMMPAKLTLFYPELSVYGASVQGRALDGVLSLEAGYYDSRQDRSGKDYTVPNPQTRFLIGYQRQMWEDFTIGLQYYNEYMHNYSEYEINHPEGLPKDKRLYQLVTIRLTQLLKHQTLKLSLFSFYSPSYRDYMLNPEIKYNFSDYIWAAIGGNIFGGGEKWSQFGQLRKNDNMYVQVRYEF